MKTISEDTLANIRDRIEIADVVSEFIDLKKTGRDLVGLCPFHDEKTPSLSVSPAKQMFYCFGCGVGGDAIAFLRGVTGESFTETILGLARRYNVPVEESEEQERERWQKQQTRQDKLRQIMASATHFYEYVLRRPVGQPALDYLHHRGFGGETLTQFQVGYAPNTWDAIFTYLTKKGWSAADIEAVGLVLPRKDGTGYYDRFRNRIMIPIRDEQGRVIAFGGRSLGDEKPKYLNSPETELFSKSKTLFGLEFAKKAITKEDRAVVVEGYFDTIALHTAGITNAVASMGTALSETQVRQLLRFTKSNRVVFNFDADAAGVKATDRALGIIGDLARQGKACPHILTLPAGKDADEFLRDHSADSFNQYIDAAPTYLEWQVNQISRRHDLKTGDGYHRATQEAIAFLNQINESDQVFYIGRCAEVLAAGVSQRIRVIELNLFNQLKRRSPLAPTQAATPTIVAQTQDPIRFNAEAIVLLLWVHRPDLRSAIFGYINYLESIQEGKTPFLGFGKLWDTLQCADNIEQKDLVCWIKDRYADDPQGLEIVLPLLHPSEKAAQDIPCSHLLSGAIVTIEQQIRKTAITEVVEQIRRSLETPSTDPGKAQQTLEWIRQNLEWIRQQQQHSESLNQFKR